MVEFVLPDELKDEESSFVLPEDLQAPSLSDEETIRPTPAGDVGVGKMAQALAAEVAISEAGRTASAF